MNMVMGNYSNANIVPFISGTPLERFIGVSMIYLRLSFDISRSELWEYFYWDENLISEIIDWDPQELDRPAIILSIQ